MGIPIFPVKWGPGSPFYREYGDLLAKIGDPLGRVPVLGTGDPHFTVQIGIPGDVSLSNYNKVTVTPYRVCKNNYCTRNS